MTRGFLIAGTHSGCGKTTISLGLMGALSKKHKVTPFKVGPDYIDPTYHKFVTGNLSYNLDLHMQENQFLKKLYNSKAALGDIAIVEGVMGLFDGRDDKGYSSSAHIAKILELPVILVVDCKAMAKSASAVVMGFQKLDPELKLAGVILNRVGGEMHFNLLKKCITQDTGVKVLGYLPQNPELIIPERALGLVPTNELNDLTKRLEVLYDYIYRYIDLDELLNIAKVKTTSHVHPCEKTGAKIKIALAQDEAFCFYYQAGLDLFKEKGVTFVPFSPINNSRLPEGVSGLYMGGGFPENFAKALSQNKSMINSIKIAIDNGLPTYAEGGGLMYLMKVIQDLKGKEYPMVGVFQGKAVMTDRLQNFGYVSAMTSQDTIIAPKDTILHGHEFHRSKIVDSTDSTSFFVKKEESKSIWECGYTYKNCLGTYVHIDFYAYPDLIDNFLKKCLVYGKENNNE